jgi:BirA family biotin operon repressor/biotin-[acetyl-CoA-carboxylase] ligase
MGDPQQSLPGVITLAQRSASTNDDALRGARAGAEHGACWIADTQTAGRGRREVGGARRAWWSPPGVNLYMSLVLRPEVPAERAAQLTLAAAVGAREAIAGFGVECGVKWPNDLLCGERKLAGILTEAVVGGAGGVDAIVVGVGVNVNAAAEDAPEGLRGRVATMRSESGRVCDRMALALAMRARIAARCDEVARGGLAAVYEELRAHDATVGRRVRSAAGAGVSRGVTAGGELEVELDDGSRALVGTGEVVFEGHGEVE